jgi:hypothetical protein
LGKIITTEGIMSKSVYQQTIRIVLTEEDDFGNFELDALVGGLKAFLALRGYDYVVVTAED